MSDFVVREGELGWTVRFSHKYMGEGPIGPRLARGTRYPSEIGVNFLEREDAEVALREWDEWFTGQPVMKKKKR
jgi:hypothetical protein